MVLVFGLLFSPASIDKRMAVFLFGFIYYSLFKPVLSSLIRDGFITFCFMRFSGTAKPIFFKQAFSTICFQYSYHLYLYLTVLTMLPICM
ncbi:uncharacterized protein F4812DRAFT_323090 [Daldinia caldariorum]|uniref:uncharacterized protein n=1 Tax=Daldinia caldariorum TaxID=326644 RepID=UPI002008A462|nr:uncharacterized protein F4812DRAFT_323090 [Daldinia caldariorum]KAI1469235.1 hypothetical protein F4812DRAFT_323090 [Daldinia caldariorum]